jgi:hypothetical protein
MRLSSRRLFLPLLLVAAASFCGCQSPTESSDTVDVDDFVESSVTPSPAAAVESPDGRTYRIVRGNNQPDDILAFQYKTSFRLAITINANALDDDVDLAFPVKITSMTAKVEQASGGIVTPATGGEVEHFESVVSGSTGNQFGAVNNSVSMNYEVWYTLPSRNKEALITVSVVLTDEDSTSFTKTVKVLVQP